MNILTRLRIRRRGQVTTVAGWHKTLDEAAEAAAESRRQADRDYAEQMDKFRQETEKAQETLRELTALVARLQPEGTQDEDQAPQEAAPGRRRAAVEPPSA